MEAITFKLEDFEGPMDLLLYLVSKNKMSLYDISILELIDQYTQIINSLQQNRMEVASEFIEMAARLVQMKSFLLLPRSAEAERMREELTGQLIEYSLCKKIAGKLGRMAGTAFVTVRAPMQVEQDATYTLRHDPSLLEQAWNSLMGRSQRRRAPAQESFEPLVTAPFVSVASRGGACAARPDHRQGAAAAAAVHPAGQPQPDGGHLPGRAGTGSRRPHHH